MRRGLAGKHVVLCVTGGIAAYKAADLVSKLRHAKAEVKVLMTASAQEFITPLTLETLAGNRVIVDTFDRRFPWEVEHIALAQWADVFAIAPATANGIAKIAVGIADDMVTTTVLATKAPIVVAPAMNSRMYENDITQKNLWQLRQRGIAIVEPEVGHLACGEEGEGKLASTEALLWGIERAVTESDLRGKRILVTAGPTQEPLDPVRYLTNHSTGKQGYAIAARAAMRGADVTLITGPTALADPIGVAVKRVVTATEMYEAVLAWSERADWVIKAAAVGDYRPASAAPEKIKKKGESLTLELVKNADILRELGRRKRVGASDRSSQLLCGFAMETEELETHAKEKLQQKGCDLLVANSLREPGAGFATETNRVILFTAEGEPEELPLLDKAAVGDVILDRLLELSRVCKTSARKKHS